MGVLSKISAVVFAAAAAGVDCQGDEYVVGSTALSWDDAREECFSLGRDLVTITSLDQNAEVFGLTNFHTWIGLNDIVEEGVYRWASENEVANFTNWKTDSGEPNNSDDNEHCVHIDLNAGEWNDLPCAAELPYVCGPVQDQYRVRDAMSRSWYDARADCAAIGRDLVTITSAEQNAEVFGLTGVRTWIGLNDIDTEGVYRWASDNSVAQYTNWENGEPNNADGLEHCVHFDIDSIPGQWNDLSCSVEIPYVCGPLREKYLYRGELRSWDDARADCAAFGRDLATITSPEQNAEIFALTGGHTWIGLNDLETEGVFRWESDNSVAEYLNWKEDSGEPNNSDGNEHCVHIDLNAGEWNDLPCRIELYSICGPVAADWLQ